MQTLAFAVLAIVLLAQVRAAEIETHIVKGKNGSEYAWDISEVTGHGFEGRRADQGSPVFVAWDYVDLEWLRENNPNLYKRREDALRLEPPVMGTFIGGKWREIKSFSGAADFVSDPIEVRAGYRVRWQLKRGRVGSSITELKVALAPVNGVGQQIAAATSEERGTTIVQRSGKFRLEVKAVWALWSVVIEAPDK